MKKSLLAFYKIKPGLPGLVSILFFSFVFTIRAQVKSSPGFSNCIIQTKDGGYALTGKTYPYSGDIAGVYVVKLDSTGNTKWTKTIAGKYEQVGNSIIQSNEGGYVLTGYAYNANNGEGLYVAKLDATGNIKWAKVIDDADNESGYSVTQAKDGNYSIIGATSYSSSDGQNIYTIKLDATGKVIWKKTIDGPKFSNGASFIATRDHGYAVGEYKEDYATTHSGGVMYDFALVKLDSAGTIKWTKTIRGAGSNNTPYCLIQTKDGGYAVTGAIDSSSKNDQDVYVVKLDVRSLLQWTKTFGGKYKDFGACIIQTSDGGFAITGTTKSSASANFDVYVTRLDGTGKVIWTKSYGGDGDDEGKSIIQTRDGGFAIAGYTNVNKTSEYDFYAIKLDGKGNLQWSKSITGGNH